MRTLLKISALALIVCAGAMLASLPDVPASKTVALGSPPAAERHRAGNAASDNDGNLQTALLATGSGIVRTRQPGYLIVTSNSPGAAAATVHVSSSQRDVAEAIAWRALSPLTVVHSNLRPRTAEPSARREFVTSTSAEQLADSDTARTYYLHVTDGPLSDPRQYVAVHSRAIADGKRVRVYLDRQRNLTPRIERMARQIIAVLEEQIIPLATREVGPWDDVDGDGRLSVLLTPWLEKLQGGKTTLKGFVRGSDFQPRYPAPFGNQADLIYFNSEVADDVHLLTLLAHEYWHVLQCSYRLSIPRHLPDAEEDWISEGTAHLAEIRYGGGPQNLAHRIGTWLDSPESAPLVVENYYAAGLWRDDGCRGATFLFFHWCERQFGDDLGLRLLTSPRAGVRNLQEVTGNNLETLQTHWTVAMLEQSRSKERSTPAESSPSTLNATPAFKDVKLGRLKIHAAEDGPKGGARFELAPTATGYVRVAPGRWKIETEQALAVPLRITFVPDRSHEPLAGPVTAGDAPAPR